MNKIAAFALILILSLALVWVGFFWQPEGEKTQQAPQGGDFELQAKQGVVALQNYRGKVVAIYFGYTWCPDVCPTSLGFLAAALNELSNEELEQFQGIFISVDPERDTLEKLATYTPYFHPELLGATGTQEQLREIAGRYGAAYRKADGGDSEMGYAVDHTSEIYLVDQQGRLAEVLRHGTPPNEILIALRRLLAAG
jgi:protein SCO1/2